MERAVYAYQPIKWHRRDDKNVELEGKKKKGHFRSALHLPQPSIFCVFSCILSPPSLLQVKDMVSASKQKRMAAKAEKAASSSSALTPSNTGINTPVSTNLSASSSVNDLSLEKLNIKVDRTATGVYTAQERSKDIKIESYSLNYHGRVLIDNASIELNFGRRYGLIGANGSGKSTFLASLAERDIEIPNHIDVSVYWVFGGL